MKIRNKNAFTLLEVLIVVAILAIMSTVGIVSMNASRIKKQLETEAQKIIAVVRQVQNNALSGKMETSGRYPCSHYFSIPIPDPNLPSKQYKASYSYKTGINLDCPTLTNSDIGIYNLENGVTFSNTMPASVKIEFNVPFGSLSNSTPDYDIILTKSGYFRHVCVCSSGKIVEKEGNNACANADCN